MWKCSEMPARGMLEDCEIDAVCNPTTSLGELGGVNTLNISVCFMDDFAAELSVMAHDCDD